MAQAVVASFYNTAKKSSKEEKVIKKMLCTKEIKLRRESERENVEMSNE